MAAPLTPAAEAHHMPGVLASPATRDVLRERVEQIARHGYTPVHDRSHFAINLIDAADAYVTQAQKTFSKQDWLIEAIDMWPWDMASFRPAPEARANLVKAAALLLAAIERIDAEAR